MIMTRLNDSLIECSVTPFDDRDLLNTPNNRALRFRPHQAITLGDGKLIEFQKFAAPVLVADCVCNTTHVSSIDSSESLLSVFKESEKSSVPVLYWLDPTGIPTRCFASIISLWTSYTKNQGNLALAVRLYGGAVINNAVTPLSYFKQTQSGYSLANPDQLANVIWYPSLMRDPELISESSKRLQLSEVYPLVEFGDRIEADLLQPWTQHRSVLDELRVRTRNFIYINGKWPDLTFKYLQNSLDAFSIIGNIVRTPVVVPGVLRLSYLAEIVATVTSGAVLSVQFDEILVDGLNEPTGTMILRRRI